VPYSMGLILLFGGTLRHGWLGIFIINSLAVDAALGQVPSARSPHHVVLYEETPGNPEGNRLVGSTLWRTETISPGPGLRPELAIRADVEVPERRLAMTLSIRRNTDAALPASHTVEIMFNLPSEFAFGGIQNVPGLLMKEAEQKRGEPLSGLAVKVTNNFFLIGLSEAEADKKRNVGLIWHRKWFDLPLVYNNGRRAILAIEKGDGGDRVVREAFAAWGTRLPDRPQARATELPRRPSLESPRRPAPNSSGSGFFISRSGHVLTNAHVVKGCTSISLSMAAGAGVPAVVVASDDRDDLAVLKADARPEHVAPLRTTPSARPGEAIVVFGFPLPGLLATSGNTSVGIVTALAGLRNDPRQLQISAPVQSGSSGGPVLDNNGNILGVVVSKLNALRIAQVTDDLPQNVNFAIKVSTAVNLLDAHSVPYEVGQQPSDIISVPDIVKRAILFSVRVKCTNDPVGRRQIAADSSTASCAPRQSASLDEEPSCASVTRELSPALPRAKINGAITPEQVIADVRAAAQSRDAAGNFVVQLVSNKSEAEVRAAFAGLQSKYPAVLGNARLHIRKTDLGGKGIYYRAGAGPFATSEEAHELCRRLKTAGGQCIVAGI
jgi:S1-C subfamily serine protease